MSKRSSMPNFSIEESYEGKIIAGIDEAGRGPLAGPVVAAAVIVDRSHHIAGINDSKKLSAKKRQELYNEIVAHYQWAVCIISNDEIDEINILEATKKACLGAVSNLKTAPDVVIVDGNMKFLDKRFVSYVKGDQLSISIAAASIVAKVTRDAIMTDLSRDFPEYLWHKNAGYGTIQHRMAIAKYGLTDYHRKSFKLKANAN